MVCIFCDYDYTNISYMPRTTYALCTVYRLTFGKLHVRRIRKRAVFLEQCLHVRRDPRVSSTSDDVEEIVDRAGPLAQLLAGASIVTAVPGNWPFGLVVETV